MKNIIKVILFIGLEILISVPLFFVAYSLFPNIKTGSISELIIANILFIIVTAISIYAFNKKFVYEDRLMFPIEISVIYIILGILDIVLGFFAGDNQIPMSDISSIFYGIISFIALYGFLNIKFKKNK